MSTLLAILIGLIGPALVAYIVWSDPHGMYSRRVQFLHDIQAGKRRAPESLPDTCPPEVRKMLGERDPKASTPLWGTLVLVAFLGLMVFGCTRSRSGYFTTLEWSVEP